MLDFQSLQTSLGRIWVVGNGVAIQQVFLTDDCWQDYQRQHFNQLYDSPQHSLVVDACIEQLEDYFAGILREFRIPLRYDGTAFQKTVWQALQTIPYGKTWTYGQLAQAIDNPKAVRAVGQANRNNPLPILIPCHRVKGANGKMVGYMGDRTDLQIKLLELEQANCIK